MGENTELCVVDASFLLAYLLPDEEISLVEDIMDRFKQKKVTLLSTYLLPFEVINTLKSVVLRKRVSSDLVYRLATDFLKMKIILEKTDFLEAILLAEKENLSVYDASYVWLARELHIPILTLDRRMKKVAKG